MTVDKVLPSTHVLSQKLIFNKKIFVEVEATETDLPEKQAVCDPCTEIPCEVQGKINVKYLSKLLMIYK